MSHPSEHEALTSQELRAALLAELEASRDGLAALSEEQLQQITGGCGECEANKQARESSQQNAHRYTWLAQGAYEIGIRERFKFFANRAQTASRDAQYWQARIDAKLGTPGHPPGPGESSNSAPAIN